MDGSLFPKVNGDCIEIWENIHDAENGFDTHSLYTVIVKPEDKEEVQWFIEEYDMMDEEGNHTKDVEPFSFKYKTG